MSIDTDELRQAKRDYGRKRRLRAFSLSRRRFMAASAAAAVAGLAPAFTGHAEARDFDTPTVKALVFDVIGSTTDYWSVVASEGEAFNKQKGLSLDWASIVAAWHPLDPPGFSDILNGHRPWESPSSLRFKALQRILDQRAPGQFSKSELESLNSVWQRMEVWPDTLPGLHRLKREYTLATLSNADMSDMVKLSKLRGLPWDLIMSSELAQTVKPSEKVYQLAPLYLGLKPEEIMMVACHKLDLHAAKSIGMRTAFVPRVLEKGPDGKVDTTPDKEFNLNASSFLELADLLKA